ncbi:hypothetical protein FDP41_011725 [Naegleria fowleri]|uniref:Uncharacterized protein n=1 Tax=Naegleria fowleri TaxID=5763 RepID=A0A6A5C5W1_NAEFO|nr:uncharacterized protein FDP41_011725 [Naegleria fowleri]KAF0981864.1 hypothetical protein FDP41_011725 [Naegleria fowleri]CAG4711707.1 unnamed protein product [Naegleria fowleri]
MSQKAEQVLQLTNSGNIMNDESHLSQTLQNKNTSENNIFYERNDQLHTDRVMSESGEGGGTRDYVKERLKSHIFGNPNSSEDQYGQRMQSTLIPPPAGEAPIETVTTSDPNV